MTLVEDLEMDFSHLSNLYVDALMSSDLLTAYEGWSVKRLAAFFIENNISGAPVVASDGGLVGVVTHSDVIRFEAREVSDAEIEKLALHFLGPFGGELSQDDIQKYKDKTLANCTVNEIMTPKVYSVEIGVSAIDACRLILEKNIHRLFVTDEGRVVGVMTAMDFLRYIMK